jgi:hypothetical protein
MKEKTLLCVIFLAVFINALSGGQETDSEAQTVEPASGATTPAVSANTVEDTRHATIKYGTETEITSLIQALKNEGSDYLDDELITLAEETKNQKIM